MKKINFSDYNSCLSGSYVVSFGADWCRDCRFAKPILEELSKKYENINFFEVDVDEDEKIRDTMGIRHIPTILFLKDGVEVCERLVEPRSANIIEECVKKL